LKQFFLGTLGGLWDGFFSDDFAVEEGLGVEDFL
jgi:hypothetical protein